MAPSRAAGDTEDEVDAEDEARAWLAVLRSGRATRADLALGPHHVMALLAELRARDWMPEPDAFEPTKRNVLAIVATGPKSFRSIASELRENCAGVGDRALRLAIRELEDEKVVIHFGRGRASVYELAIRSRSRLQIVAES